MYLNYGSVGFVIAREMSHILDQFVGFPLTFYIEF